MGLGTSGQSSKQKTGDSNSARKIHTKVLSDRIPRISLLRFVFDSTSIESLSYGSCSDGVRSDRLISLTDKSPMFRTQILRVWQRFRSEEDGATAVEYAVMIALIVAVCLAGASQLANATGQSFSDTADAIAGAFN
jgi:pilus assembly protein Flp/PilA